MLCAACVIVCIGVNKVYPECCSVFNTCLTIFQSRELLIHFMFVEMKNVLVSLRRCFIKPINFEGKSVKELMKIDAADKENHLEMRNINFGIEVKQQVVVYSVG